MRTIISLLCIMVFAAPVLSAEPPVTAEKWALEVFGNERGAEARFLALGPQGGAVGVYAGAGDSVLDTGDAVRFGALARYNMISNGQAPVSNLFPQLIAQFLGMFGLPQTTPVNTYAGISIGGLYGYGHAAEDLSWELRPHIGVQAGMVGMELSRGLGDLTGEADAGSGWLVSVGVSYRW